MQENIEDLLELF